MASTQIHCSMCARDCMHVCVCERERLNDNGRKALFAASILRILSNVFNNTNTTHMRKAEMYTNISEYQITHRRMSTTSSLYRLKAIFAKLEKRNKRDKG